MRKRIWCLIAAFSCLDATAEREQVVTENVVQNQSENKDINNTQRSNRETKNRFNVAAEKIAGIGLPKSNDPEFQKYSDFINASWNKLYEESLGLVPLWTEKNIRKLNDKYDTVFYPFGGPDISYAVSFFPDAKRYILVGLEPLGDFDQIEGNLTNPEYYHSVQTAFSTYLNMGYFITSEMTTQLSNPTVKGGLNLILLALKKLGFDVLKVSNCSIDANGDISETTSPDNISCVKLICEKNSEKKEIYYIRTNLSNGSRKLSNLTKFVHKFEFSTFVKSASYALHDRNFTNIRSFILNKTHCILQDDTGIPFNFFRQNWDIHIFGAYTKPTLQVFRTYKQNSLSEYYSNHKAEPISFSIGYGYIKRTPNLIFAISQKKKVEEQVNELRGQLKKKKCSCSENSQG